MEITYEHPLGRQLAREDRGLPVPQISHRFPTEICAHGDTGRHARGSCQLKAQVRAMRRHPVTQHDMLEYYTS
jgi:hypothetical protein